MLVVAKLMILGNLIFQFTFNILLYNLQKK
jgi:hypothetical protein